MDNCTGCKHRGAYNCGDLCKRKFMDKYHGIFNDGVTCKGCDHEGTTHGSCKRCTRHFKDYFEATKPLSEAEKQRCMNILSLAGMVIATNPARRRIV